MCFEGGLETQEGVATAVETLLKNVSTAAGQRRGGGHVCPRCLAGGEGRPYVDMGERFHNEADLAVAAATRTRTRNKYKCSWDS